MKSTLGRDAPVSCVAALEATAVPTAVPMNSRRVTFGDMNAMLTETHDDQT